jgi:hypothetical protein
MRLLPLLAVAALAGGCGGMNAEDYSERVAKASAAVQVAMAGAGQDAGKLDATSKSIAAAADDVERLDPPGEAEDVNTHIADGFRKLAGTFHQAAAAARSGDLDRRDDILEHLDTSPGLRELEAAESELDELSEYP